MIRSDMSNEHGKTGDDSKQQTSLSPEDRNSLIKLANAMVTAFASGAGGFTLEPIKATDVGRIKKYAVGVAGYECRFSGIPTRRDCLAYLERIASVLFDPLLEMFLGGWEKSALETVCDVVELFDDFDEALAFADANKQEAFTYLLTLEEFNVEEEKRRKARAHRHALVAGAN